MRKIDALALVAARSGEVVVFGNMIAPKGVSIKHTVKVGGGSFTDGKHLQTGLFDFFINDEEEIDKQQFKPSHGLYSLKGLTAHEYGHVWFTSFSVCKKFADDLVPEFEAEGINSNFARKIVNHIFNCTEDGRIEKRMVNLYNGLINYFRYNNGTIWNLDSEELPDLSTKDKELSSFLRCICSYSVVGIRPKWYKNTKGLRIREEAEKTYPFIDKAIDAPTCKKNAEITYSLIKEVWDYLIELMKEVQEDQEAMQELMDAMADLDVGEGNEGEGDGSSAGSGSATARMSEGKTGEDGDGRANNIGDNSGAAGSTQGREQRIEAYQETTEMSTEMPGYDYSGVSGDGGGSTKVIKSKNNWTTPSPEEIVGDALKEAEGLAEKEMQNPAKKKEPKVTSSTLNSEEISRMVTAVGYDKEHIRTYREEKPRCKKIPIDQKLVPAANKFRKKVERCFKEKNMELPKMSSGKLDTKQLYKFGLKEYNVFKKMANRSLADAVVEICWDGSGSMCGGKQKLSADACAIIEEGLKGVVPLKIINFTTDWSHQEVVHYNVKDFDENDRSINYTLSYSKSKNFNGGNKDGYDIRVCTEELMKRGEKDKILIVMSDGLPSDYDSIDPQEDVKDAVKCARKKGIVVIPIFFGDSYFRESALSAYEYMYEKHIINSAPEELPNRLAKLLEALVLK